MTRPSASGPGPRPGMEPSPLDRVVVVLDEPQDLVNVAGVVRAMKNMGLSRLRLVRPAEFDAYRITGIAHRADDIVDRVEIFEELDEALSDIVFLVGSTARARTARRNYGRPRELAAEIVRWARSGPVGLLLGREDRGLSNEGLDRCHAVAVVPTAPGYSSLNLAQAFIILAYEILLAGGGGEGKLPEGKRSAEPATERDLEEMYGALKEGLDRIDFFKARSPETVMRTVRTVLSRASPNLLESRLLRAVGYEIRNYLDRTRPRDEERVDRVSSESSGEGES